jgi:hypothetical protein
VSKAWGAFDFSQIYYDGANDTAHLDWEENLLVGAQKLLALYQAHF